MSISKAVRMLSMALCFVLLTAGAGVAASFGEMTGGVKTLTESAKDVNDIHKDQKQNSQSEVSTQKSTKKSPQKSTKKASSPKRSAPQDSRVRGG